MVGKMRISILSNVNLDMLGGLLKKEYEIFQTDGYGEWITYALNRDEKLAAFAPDCLLLLLEGNELLSHCTGYEQGAAHLAQTAAYVQKLAENYPNSYLLVSSIDRKPERIRQRDGADDSLRLRACWDAHLTELTQTYSNVHRFELASLIENYGRNTFYSAKFWYMGAIPYDMKALHALAEEIKKTLGHLQTVRRKVLTLDFDNTLWGGVIGEDGVEGIVLDTAHEGAIYRDAQRRIKQMQDMGVLLAAASKNNIEDVKEVWEHHPHMLLKEEDFAASCIDWNPKAENIRKMAQELNLGTDSFVFLDDNEMERAAVHLALPETAVAEFPTDLTALPQVIEDIYENYFWTWKLTEEDREKTAQYQSEKQRREEKDKMLSGQQLSFEDYLRSLETKITLSALRPALESRAVQLMNKTNQFNTCTLRMDALALAEYQRQGGQLILASVSDKYGNSGWAVEFFYHMEENTAVVDNFLMSCRVMGRKIEDAVFEAVIEKLRADGISQIQASYKKSAKNKPVEDLWDRLGLACVREENEEKWYSLTLEGSSTKQETPIHTVCWE